MNQDVDMACVLFTILNKLWHRLVK